MQTSTSREKKIGLFASSSKKEWIEAAKLELEGTGLDEKLKLQIDGIAVFPYYDQSDLPEGDFQLPPSQNEFLGPRAWFNVPRITVINPTDSNEKALWSLNSGADGVLFELSGTADASVLLKDIELPHCCMTFLAGIGHEAFFHEYAALASAKKYGPPLMSGAIFWDACPAGFLGLMKKFRGWDQFHVLGIAAGEIGPPTELIGTLLAKAVKQIDFLVDQGVKINEALHSVAFSVSIGNDFFLETAKLKTLRRLWIQVARTYDPHNPAPIFIHARVKAWENQEYQPHGNMLKSTTAAMSAIFGGCDALTVEPGEKHHEMMNRVARNVSSILREESHLGKVADPTAGSYYLENYMDHLAQGAWKRFQILS